MSNLRDSIAQYLALRRSLGFLMEKAENVLKNFSSFAKKEEKTFITTELVLRWLDQQSTVSAATRSARLSMVRCFAIWRRASDPRTAIIPKRLLCCRYQRKTHPFFLCRLWHREMGLLLSAATWA